MPLAAQSISKDKSIPDTATNSDIEIESTNHSTVADTLKGDSLVYEGFGCRMTYPNGKGIIKYEEEDLLDEPEAQFSVHDTIREIYLDLYIYRVPESFDIRNKEVFERYSVDIDVEGMAISEPTYDVLGGNPALRLETSYTVNARTVSSSWIMTARNGYADTIDIGWRGDGKITRETIQAIFDSFSFTGKLPGETWGSEELYSYNEELPDDSGSILEDIIRIGLILSLIGGITFSVIRDRQDNKKSTGYYG